MLVVAVGLLVGGCGVAGSGAPAAPAVADASRVDMCTILTDAELSQLGIRPETRRQVERSGLVGCGWVGKPFTLDLERDKDAIATYQARRRDPAFTSFSPPYTPLPCNRADPGSVRR